MIRLSLVIQFVLLVVVLEDSVTVNGSWFRAHFYKRPPQPRRGQDLLNTPTHHFFETEMCHVWKLQGDLFKWQTDAHAGHVCNGGVIPSIPRPAWLLFNVAQVTSGTSQTMWGGPHGRIFATLVSRAAKLLCFEWSPPGPTVTNYFVIVSDISSGSIYGIFSDILFWHSIWNSIPTVYSGILLSGIYSDVLSGILSGIYSDIFSGILSGILSAILSGIDSDILSGIHSGILSGILCSILSDILFWHSFWHLFWLSILPLYLAFIPAFFLAFYLAFYSILTSSLDMGTPHWGWRVRQPTETWPSPLRSSSAHWDLQLAVEVR